MQNEEGGAKRPRCPEQKPRWLRASSQKGRGQLRSNPYARRNLHGERVSLAHELSRFSIPWAQPSFCSALSSSVLFYFCPAYWAEKRPWFGSPGGRVGNEDSSPWSRPHPHLCRCRGFIGMQLGSLTRCKDAAGRAEQGSSRAPELFTHLDSAVPSRTQFSSAVSDPHGPRSHGSHSQKDQLVLVQSVIRLRSTSQRFTLHIRCLEGTIVFNSLSNKVTFSNNHEIQVIIIMA